MKKTEVQLLLHSSMKLTCNIIPEAQVKKKKNLLHLLLGNVTTPTRKIKLLYTN